MKEKIQNFRIESSEVNEKKKFHSYRVTVKHSNEYIRSWDACAN